MRAWRSGRIGSSRRAGRGQVSVSTRSVVCTRLLLGGPSKICSVIGEFTPKKLHGAATWICCPCELGQAKRAKLQWLHGVFHWFCPSVLRFTAPGCKIDEKHSVNAVLFAVFAAQAKQNAWNSSVYIMFFVDFANPYCVLQHLGVKLMKHIK